MIRSSSVFSGFPLAKATLLSIFLFLMASQASAQAVGESGLDDAQLKRVFPAADSFSPKQGEPPVYSAFRDAEDGSDPQLIGYLFETPDVPPEEIGYSAPIEVLVGIDMDGVLTGIEVLFYRESYKSIRGDFINSEYFPNQFDDKYIGDGFRVGRDIDGISRATISSWAVARGVRNAARRVAEVYLTDSEFVASKSSDGIALQILAEQSWQDMKESGLVRDLSVRYPDETELKLSFAFMGHDGLGELLVGADDYSRADREASNRVNDGNMLLVGIDGDASLPFRQERLAVMQGERNYEITRSRFVYVGSADFGKIRDEVRFAGAMVLDPDVDLTQPFTVMYNAQDQASGFFSIASLQYQVPPVSLALAQGTPLPAEFMPVNEDEEYDDYAEQGTFASLINNASLLEVGAMLLLLVIVMTAFLRKSDKIRWVALTYTLFYLGWYDGSFVSVSHITNGIKLGPSMFMNDLPLLLILTFTVVTTFLWGRIFCSSLCPFGALQDFITRIVPRKLQWKVPQGVHDKAIYIKYGLLAFLIVMALVSEMSLFQYFEPFGTVFYLSRSPLLWSIAAAILAAALVIPRFYCRYACPLGAALGVVSMVAPSRIQRVPQCDVCSVCEHACPTGAIRGPAIDFKECVRCDICESKLIARSGVCKHDMEVVKVRVKNWQPATA